MKKIVYQSYKGGNSSLNILDLENNKETMLLKDINFYMFRPQFSNDDSKILFDTLYRNANGGGKGQICLYDLKTKQIDELTDENTVNGEASFTPDGKKIIFSGNRDGKGVFFIMDANGRNLTDIPCIGNHKSNPRMSYPAVFNDSVIEKTIKNESKVDEIPEVSFPEIKDNNLEGALKSNGLIIVDAYTTWCGPCKEYSKNILSPASQKYKNVRFMKVDAEKNREISKKYDIDAYPTTLVFKDGKFITKFIGAEGGILENIIKKYAK